MNFKFNLGPKNTEQLPPSSQAEVVARKYTKQAEEGKIDVEKLVSEEAIKENISSGRLLKQYTNVTPEEVFVELKKMGVITVPPPEKKIIQPVPEILHRGYQKLTHVEDENTQLLLEQNKFYIELEKDVFRDEQELDLVLEQSLSLGKENFVESKETDEYYLEFADEGLIKGGENEVNADLDYLEELKGRIERDSKSLESGKAKKEEKASKIATIVERAVAYGVTNLGWFSKNIKMQPTSKFDDIKNGVDGVVEIERDERKSSFMGLGIDVTFRGLLSESYKNKFFKLLQLIQNGSKTKIKYFKNHKGKRMEEFAVPKIILSFNIEDVKNLIYMIKNGKDPKVKEQFINSPQKFAIMNQVILQCEMLGAFAKESNNDIFVEYEEIVSSIKKLAKRNPEIQQMLDARHEDDVSRHMRFLIQEFKATKEFAKK